MGAGYGLLAAVSLMPEKDLQSALAKLADSELIYATGIPPDASYTFKHALIQDAAYEALLKSRRRELHRRVALAIVEKSPTMADTHQEVLARHWTEAGEAPSAIIAWRKAGDAAFERRAFKEAEHSYRQALEMLRGLPESPERDRRELELMSPFARVLQLTRGWAAPEAAEAAAHTWSLAQKAGSLPQLVLQLMGTWAVVVSAGDLTSAGTIANQLLDLAECEGSPASLGVANTAQVISRYFRGDLSGAEEHFMRGAPFFESAWKIFPAASNLFGAASYVAWIRGHADIARDRSRKGTSIAGELNNPFEVAYAQLWAAGLHLFIGEHEQAGALAAQSVALSNEQGGFLQIASAVRIGLGRAQASLDRTDTGVPQIRQGLSEMVKAGGGVDMTLYLAWLAEALALDGDISGALATIEEALQANSEELTWRLYALTVRGELLLKLRQTEAADSTCRDAIAQAKKIGAKALELRATIGLARLLTEQSKRNEARAILADIYNWFTEGFDTADLKDAKALLDELSN